MEDTIAALTKRVEELERAAGIHIRQSDIFPSTIKTRHLDDEVLSGYLSSTSALNAALLTISSQAIGDILYASSTSAFARLAAGATNTFLKGGATPSYAFAFSNYKLQSHTRDMTASAGDVTYTGYGFTPKLIIVFGSFDGSASDAFTFGIYDGTTDKSMSQDEGGDFSFSDDLLVAWDTYPSANQAVSVTTFNSDGFVLTWTKAGVPAAGTFKFGVLALG